MFETEELELEALYSVCGQCGHRFDSYKLSDFFYGPLLMVSEDHDPCALVDGLSDPICDEVGGIVDDLLAGSNLTEDEVADAFQDVFGVSCDAVDGQDVHVKRGWICPTCESRDVDLIDYDPPKWVKRRLRRVTHNWWSTLSASEKRELIEEAVKKQYPHL